MNGTQHVQGEMHCTVQANKLEALTFAHFKNALDLRICGVFYLSYHYYFFYSFTSSFQSKSAVVLIENCFRKKFSAEKQERK